MDDKPKSKGRILTEAEKNLWDLVTSDVDPIEKNDLLPSAQTPPIAHKRNSKPTPQSDGDDISSFSIRQSPRITTNKTIPTASAHKSKNVYQTTRDDPASSQLDGRTAQRLKQGKITIEDTIDLHGMTQPEAHARLNMFIQNAHRQQYRCVLVITGKGTRGPSAPHQERGILRKQLPEWLGMSPLAPLVLQHHPSRQQHGGAGAFYVYLRRQRPS